MNDKVLQTLEFDKILRRLAGHADFSASKDALIALKPLTDYEAAALSIDETSEARHLLNENPRVSIMGAHDIRQEASDSARGGILQPERLLRIQGTLEASIAIRKILGKGKDRFPILFNHSNGMLDDPSLIALISNAIDEYAQIRDTATPELTSVRRTLRSEVERLQTKLQTIIRSGMYASILQEGIVTMRNGRYVIPIRSESKGNIKGIIHDQSSSGATVFVEPLETVAINNRIRELEMQEAEEIQKILSALSLEISQRYSELIQTVESITAFDMALAKARYANSIDAEAPELLDFSDPANREPVLRLVKARHPLIDPRAVVPIDVELEEGIRQLVITGPNTGGKTVTLKTVGLLSLMAQSGLHIPAYEESRLSVFQSLFADIGDEQSIEQSLSTFSGHLSNVIAILEQADEHSLVLIDELGSGTDPAEGAAIARAILEDLLQRNITTLVATHYPELKAFAQTTPGVTNASMEFNVETLTPTYRLIIGLPGRSNALTIATRLGVPARIIEKAKSSLDQSDMQVDDLIEEVIRLRDEARILQRDLTLKRAAMEKREAELANIFERFQQERQDMIHQAEAEMEQELGEMREEIASLRRNLRSLSPTIQARLEDVTRDVEQAAADVEVLENLIAIPVTKPDSLLSKAEQLDIPQELLAGDYVFVPSMNTSGQIMSITGKEAEVLIGSLRTRIQLDRLEWRSRRKMKSDSRLEAASQEVEIITIPDAASPGMEINLIKLTVDEAIPLLNDYLDRAYRAGLPWARIVHGKGTGALRRAVHDRLKRHPLVRDFKLAVENEGGSGVTIVHFNPSR